MGLPLGVTIYAYDSFNGDGVSLVPSLNISVAGIVGYEFNKFTGEGVWAVCIGST